MLVSNNFLFIVRYRSIFFTVALEVTINALAIQVRPSHNFYFPSLYIHHSTPSPPKNLHACSHIQGKTFIPSKSENSCNHYHTSFVTKIQVLLWFLHNLVTNLPA